MENYQQTDVDRNVKIKEKWVADILSPMEPMVLSFQSLLVWENPKKSALLFTAVHISFWFLAYISSRFYFLICIGLIIIIIIDTWKKQIWPEIRVPPSVPDYEDDWTPVHARLLSSPEISCYIAQALYFIQSTLTRWRQFRRNHPQKFCFFASSFFITLYMVSRCVSGLTLVYTLVMSLLLWPCVVYHNLIKRSYLYMEPVFMWLDYQLKHFKVAKAAVTDDNPTSLPVSDVPTAMVVDDDDEFCPAYDPETTAALARAITDSEDEGGTPSIPTPGLSKEPSIDSSDDERDVANDFEPSIDQMPSFDDLDQTDDEWSPGSPSNRSGNIQFTPTHFGDDSDSDEDRLGDISIPDINDSEERGLITHHLVSQTLTNLMENALQSFSPNQDNSSYTSDMLPRSGARLTYTKTSHGESFDITDPMDDTIIEEDEEDESSTDAENIEKEFDFLDDYNQNSEKKK